MTWTVLWDGREYDVDPNEFTGLELSRIKQRTGLSFRQLISAIGDFDGDAIRALFWTVEGRTAPDLNYRDYSGPPMRVIVGQMEGFSDSMEFLGKALGGVRRSAATETSGGPSSSTPTTEPSPTPTPTTD